MRHAPIALAEQAARHAEADGRWDVIVCSDMLDLATFYGLAGAPLRSVPAVAYFHENQLTYPVRRDEPRDVHFGITNLTTALAAASIWFNSAYHRHSFIRGLSALLRKMPDHQPLEAVDRIHAKSCVHSPAVEPFALRAPRQPGALRVLWAARWEYDKGPDVFFEAVQMLVERKVNLRLSVIGQRFREAPPVFAQAQDALAGQIDRWGYQPSREEYTAALAEADVFVSTAQHEFFGISAVEAIAAGAYPVLPNRLAYPEVLGQLAGDRAGEFLYDGSVGGLADRLAALADRLERGLLWAGVPGLAQRAQEQFGWQVTADVLDDALGDVLPERAGSTGS